jgi:hypothetical protein
MRVSLRVLISRTTIISPNPVGARKFVVHVSITPTFGGKPGLLVSKHCQFLRVKTRHISQQLLMQYRASLVVDQ